MISMRRTAIIGTLLLGIAIALASVVAQADEAIRARGWVHQDKGFGRLVFDWTKPVGYSAKIEDQKLVIEFDRPASFNTSRALSLLSPYISSIAEQTDRRLVLNLTGTWKLKSFTDSTRVV